MPPTRGGGIPAFATHAHALHPPSTMASSRTSTGKRVTSVNSKDPAAPREPLTPFTPPRQTRSEGGIAPLVDGFRTLQANARALVMGPRLRPKPSDYKPPPRQTTFTPWANTQTSLPSTWVQPPASDEDSTDQETTPDTDDENASPESLETSSSTSNVSGQKRSRKQLKRQRARQAAREKHERRLHALRARARDAIRAAAECEAQGVENDADATTLVRPVNTRGPYRTWVKEGWLPLIHLTNLSLGSVTKGVTFMRNWVFCGERHLAHLPVNTVRAWYANVCMLELRPEYHKLTLPGADPSEFRSGTWHGSAKFADKYPDFVQHMCEVFRGMREAGLLLTSDIVAEQFRHFAKEWCPHELIHMAFSRPWCRGICREKLNYVFRKATGAAQKLPLDWQTQKEDFVRRVTAVYMVECEDLAFVVNTNTPGPHRSAPNPGGQLHLRRVRKEGHQSCGHGGQAPGHCPRGLGRGRAHAPLPGHLCGDLPAVSPQGSRPRALP